MRELVEKLSNVIDSNYTPVNGEGMDRVLGVVADIIKSFGGCLCCYGKGYIVDLYDFCECERGRNLKELVHSSLGSRVAE
jgi:hypothetical protein